MPRLLTLRLCVAALVVAIASAQITDVVVTEDLGGAPSPATITTVDVAGNVNQRQVAPGDVAAALADALGAPAPGQAPCPAICAAVDTCISALNALCDISNGAFCLTESACPAPAFCAACGTAAAPAPAST